jgi:hypothetical protein
MYYGIDPVANFHRAPTYVVRILKGEKNGRFADLRINEVLPWVKSKGCQGAGPFHTVRLHCNR